MTKLLHRNSLDKTNMTYIFLTQPTKALAGSVNFQIFGAKEEGLTVP